MDRVSFFGDFSTSKAYAKAHNNYSHIAKVDNFFCVVLTERQTRDITISSLSSLLYLRRGFSIVEIVEAQKLKRNTILNDHIKPLIEKNIICLTLLNLDISAELYFTLLEKILPEITFVNDNFRISENKQISFSDIKKAAELYNTDVSIALLICADIRRKFSIYNPSQLFKDLSGMSGYLGFPISKGTDHSKMMSNLLVGQFSSEFIKNNQEKLYIPNLWCNPFLEPFEEGISFLKDCYHKQNHDEEKRSLEQKFIDDEGNWCGNIKHGILRRHVLKHSDLEFLKNEKSGDSWSTVSCNPYISESLFNKFKEYLDFKKLSTNTFFNWDHEKISEHKELIDFKALSQNKGIQWTSNILDEFKECLCWTQLCSNSSVNWTEKLIDIYVANIDWSALSRSSSVKWTKGLLEKHHDKWNWFYLVCNNDFNNYFDINFLFFNYRGDIHQYFCKAIEAEISTLSYADDLESSCDGYFDLLIELENSNLVINSNILNGLLEIDDIIPVLHTYFEPKKYKVLDYTWDVYKDEYQTMDSFYDDFEDESIIKHMVMRNNTVWTDDALQSLILNERFNDIKEELVRQLKLIAI